MSINTMTKNKFNSTTKSRGLTNSQKTSPTLSPSKYNQDNEEYNNQDQNIQYENNEQYKDMTMKLPAKEHIAKLEEMLNELIRQNDNHKKARQILRTEIISLEYINKDECNEINKIVRDGMLKIQKDFQKGCQINKNDNNKIKEQITYYNAEKMKIQQNALILDNRITHVESNVGFKIGEDI